MGEPLKCNVRRTSAKMQCGLSQVFGAIASRVPEGPLGEADFVFRREDLPRPPAELRTDSIVVQRTTHDYNSWYRADALWIYLGRRKARELGVFLLACMFSVHEEDTLLLLDHPQSHIRRIVVSTASLARVACRPRPDAHVVSLLSAGNGETPLGRGNQPR